MTDSTLTPEDGQQPERRIGVYICHCGGNISDYVDVEAVRDAMKDEPGVVVSVDPIFACSDGTQLDMIADIREKGLDGLVVASCSPKLHQVTFRNVAKRADLNPYAYTQVNVREQASWAHTHDKEGATEKVIGLVRAGVAKTRLSEPLHPLVIETVQKSLVVGGGIAGLRAAIGLADIGLAVTLIERQPVLGGWVGTFGPTFPNDAVGREEIATLVADIKMRSAITVFTSAELVGKSGTFGNYAVEIAIKADGNEHVVQDLVGSIIIATGFDSYSPEEGELGYGIPGVLTLPEFKQMIDAATSELTFDGRKVRSVAYLYCVGSRQAAGGNEYCSKFCCTSAIHSSIELHAIDSSIRQYHLHRDIRAYGRNELLYEESREAGSTYLKMPDDTPPTVKRMDDGRLAVGAVDLLTNSREVTIPVDLVVLVTGMVPRENRGLIDLLKLPIGSDGFFNEIHPKLRPVETVVDGVLIAGCSQAPRTAGESVASGLSAVAQSAALLKKGYAELEPLVAKVEQDACTGCRACVDACPYAAIDMINCDGREVASVSAASCKGCGGCVPVCDDDAINLLGYTDAQMRAAIENLVLEPVS